MPLNYTLKNDYDGKFQYVHLPGSSVHGILQARIVVWVAISFSRVFLTEGSNPGLLHCSQILYHLSCQGSPLATTTTPHKDIYANHCMWSGFRKISKKRSRRLFGH